MKIAICDDEQRYLQFLEKKIKDNYIPSNDDVLNVFTFLPDKLCTLIEERECNFDIILIDILMKKYNGIDMVRKINRLNPQCIIIYISNYIDQAVNVYETSHAYFVLKSELDNLLPRALKKAEQILSKNREQITLPLKGLGAIHHIPVNDILFFEVFGHTISVITREPVSYVCSTPLKKLITILPDQFIRIHNSYVVNMDYIRSFQSNEIILNTEKTLPVSRTYKKSFQETYTKYITRFL